MTCFKKTNSFVQMYNEEQLQHKSHLNSPTPGWN